MKLEMWQYNKLIEITGGSYSASKSADEDSVMLYDCQSAIEDLITEFGVLEESHTELKERIQKKIDELEEHKFMIDMIDRWTDGEDKVWSRLVDEINMLKGLIENDR